MRVALTFVGGGRLRHFTSSCGSDSAGGSSGGWRLLVL